MLHRIASRVLNRPLLILPSAAETIASVLGERIGIEPMATTVTPTVPRESRFAGEEVVYDARSNRELYGISNGIAIITVAGELVNRGAWVGASSGLVSFEGIAHQLHTAAADPKVWAIVLDVDSPGGEASGAMELAATVRAISAVKPVYGFANGMAASAGYAMLSGTKKIYTIPTGIVGSIGVVLLHLDRAGQYEKVGIKPTLIFAGAHKVDGHPFGPLPESVTADLQAEVNAFYEAFVGCVAAGRSNLSDKDIRATEARIFIGREAVSRGLADAVATSITDVLAEISQAKGLPRMTTTPGAPAATTAGISAEDHARAVSDAQTAATQRLATIMAADGIKGNAARMTFAMDLAAKAPGMSAEDIIAMAKAHVVAAPGLAERMEHNPANAIGGNAPPASGATIKQAWKTATDKVNASRQRANA